MNTESSVQLFSDRSQSQIKRMNDEWWMKIIYVHNGYLNIIIYFSILDT